MDKKKLDERNIKVLQDLAKEKDNQNCADCGSRGNGKK